MIVLSTLQALCSFAAAGIVGQAVLSKLDGGRRPGLLMWPMTMLAGVALCSALYWLWITLLRATGLPYLALELLAVAAAIWMLRSTHRNESDRLPRSWWLLPACAMLILLLIAAAVQNRVGSFGGPDAWRTWNVKARFLYHAQDDWTLTFDKVAGHRDYPLLLPITVARAWCYIGDDGSVGPRTVSYMFFALWAASIFTGAVNLRGVRAAIVGLMMFVMMPWVLRDAVCQYADIPVSAYMIGGLLATVIAWEQPGEQRRSMILAGLLAAGAAWTKNEGAAYCVILLVIASGFWLARRTRRSSLPWLWAGAAGVLIVLLWMRLGYAPASAQLKPPDSESRWAALIDPQRQGQLWRAFKFAVLQHMGGSLWLIVLLWLLLRGMRVGATAVMWLAVLLCQAVVYGLVYLLTPYDIGWQLSTSFTRVVGQIWPLVALLPVVLARGEGEETADESASAGPGGVPAHVAGA
ncbi:MAG: hypothetical protein IT445_19495 [Phycisphaeraceae bacterium]|nr:hypothetical protein [Phycisphaeraceae bacterium]